MAAERTKIVSEADKLFSDPKLNEAIRDLVSRVAAAQRAIHSPLTAADREPALALARNINERRGRPLFFEGIVGSGLGKGPLVELADGTVKYDFITAIGTNFFGHGDPDLMETAIRAAMQDVAMQGNLHPNREYFQFLDLLCSHAPGRLKRGWLATSGADANENALKIARQKRGRARLVIAFEGCFAGRTSAMAEITDSPGYRKGQPLFGQVLYIPFFDKRDPAGSTERSVGALQRHLDRFREEVCALMVELIQGEGGFNSAPREFFEQLFRVAKTAGVPVWVDEIQTFGRTRSLFATEMLGLGEHVDLLTVAKLAQVGCTLFTEEMTPDTGLLSGTFSGSTVSLALGRRILERLTTEGFYGAEGKNARTEALAVLLLEELARGRCKGLLRDPAAVGTMVSFVPFNGQAEMANRVLKAIWERGVICFNAGHDPTKIRMLLPGGALTEEDLRKGIALIGDALLDLAKADAPTRTLTAVKP